MLKFETVQDLIKLGKEASFSDRLAEKTIYQALKRVASNFPSRPAISRGTRVSAAACGSQRPQSAPSAGSTRQCRPSLLISYFSYSAPNGTLLLLPSGA